MQYCSYSIRLYFHHPSHPQLGIVFAWLHPFILSGVISPLISSSLLGTYQPGEFIFQCPFFLPFHTVPGVLKARILKWFAIPVSSGPHSVRPLHHDLPVLAPQGHPKSGAVAERSYPMSEVRGGSREELSSVGGQGRQPRGVTPCPRSGTAAWRSYHMPEVRGSG